MGAGFPLWRDSVPSNADSTLWELSDELAAILSSWQEDFDYKYDPVTGWTSMESLSRHFQEAVSLKERVELELPSNAVELDYWQTIVDGKEEPFPPHT